MFEVFQINETTYTIKMGNRVFELTLKESDAVYDLKSVSESQKKRMTKAIFSNEDILEQLRDAKKNRDRDFSYYSGDEDDFDQLVDEVNGQ